MQKWYYKDKNSFSDFDNEEFETDSQKVFKEATYTSVGNNVEICNFDLTERKPLRVIFTGRVSDTPLKTTQRNMLAPIGNCKAGQYVYYKKRYWLILGLVDDNSIYEKATLALCNELLTWKNYQGKVVQRWACVHSASQYNNGESQNKNYVLRSDQFLISAPNDKECLFIENGHRFIIDGRCKEYEGTFKDKTKTRVNLPVFTYRLSRINNSLYDYQDSGYTELLVSQDEQHDGDGYYYVDGKGYWLCGEPKIDEDKPLMSSKIEYKSLDIYNGVDPETFTAKFYDENGEVVEVAPSWEIKSDFTDELKIQKDKNTISISIDNTKFINKSFELLLHANGYEDTSVKVFIRAFI